MAVLTNVPSLSGKDTSEQLRKISAYLQTLKRDIEYELQNFHLVNVLFFLLFQTKVFQIQKKEF